MQNELGNQRLSARYLEGIEDDLDANPTTLFASLSEADKITASERLRLAVPQLLNAYRNRLLSGKDQRTIDPNFLENLSDAANNTLAPELIETDPQAKLLAQKFRDALPVLIHAYRLEFGLPLRMR